MISREKTPELREEDEKETFREYMRNLDLTPEDLTGKVLDVGSGSGEFARYAKKEGISADIYDIDPSEQTRRPNAVRGRARRMPFPDGTFDMVISHAAIPGVFISDDKEGVKSAIRDGLREIVRVCKPGGEIRLGRVLKGDVYENQRLFAESLKEILDELKKEGVRVEEVRRGEDTYEYDDEGNPARTLARSFLIVMKKPAEEAHGP